MVLPGTSQAAALLSGASGATVLQGLERRRGPGSVERVLARVRTSTGLDVGRGSFHPRSWHPIGLHLALLREIHEETGRDADALRALGRESAAAVEDAVPGARLLLRLASPKRLLKHAPALWRTYARFGDAQATEVAPRQGRIAFSGFETSPLFCRTLEGFFEGLLERTGARDVRVREVCCMADGAERCEFEGAWRDR